MLQAIARDAFGKQADNIRSVRGGDINQAARVEVGGGWYFVKYKLDAPPRFFETEARGLDLLRAAGEIRVPEVIRYAEANGERPAFLAQEWIDQAEPSRNFAERFGRALAALHRHTAPTFGLDLDNVIGGLAQPEKDATNWPTYYRNKRLKPQVDLARQQGRLPPECEAALQEVMDRIEELLNGLESVPSLLHGDLWGGNYMCAANDEPVLYDPHSYYGEREAEIAFTELFGGFDPGFYKAYREAYTFPPRYEYRTPP